MVMETSIMSIILKLVMNDPFLKNTTRPVSNKRV
jgi:hypothetical protein